MSQGRKRTKITIKKKSASVTVLRFEDMIINNGKGKKEYLHRLCYLNAPTVSQIALGNEVLANRDDVVRVIYETLQPLPDNRSKQTYFLGLIYYFRYLDSNQYQGDVFDNEIMKESIKHFNRVRSKGKQKSKAGGIKSSLSFFLRQWNREADLKVLPLVAGNPPAKDKAFHVETELKPLSRVLIKGALAFQEAIEINKLLDIHPFFDEELFTERAKSHGWTVREISDKKTGFKMCMKPQTRIIKESPLPLEQLNRQAFL